MTVHFATQLYQSEEKNILSTILPVLRRNLTHPSISSSTVFLDHCAIPWQLPGVNWITLNRRATYADYLKLASDLTMHSASHFLFANSDILMDQGVEHLASHLTSDASVACITRIECTGKAPADVANLQSQDAWMLRSHPVDTFLLEQLKGLNLGVPGCEHLFATALVAHGYDLWNPCLNFRALHMDPDPASYHIQQERYWGLYAYVPECRIEDIEKKRPDVFFSFAQKPGRYFHVSVG
jgi:hypothetical protein